MPNIFYKEGKLFQKSIKEKNSFSTSLLGWGMYAIAHRMTSLRERRPLRQQLLELLLNTNCH